jgi:putative MFS transporter
VGGILAPMAVAALITQPEGFSKIFMMFTGVLLAVVAVIVLLGEETRGRTLEDISS